MESGTLAAIGYDAAGELLQVEFCSRAVYRYFDVPAGVHKALLNATSKGSFFNQSIRGRFPYRQASGRPAAQHAGAPLRGQE
jgi:hypothetical protein